MSKESEPLFPRKEPFWQPGDQLDFATLSELNEFDMNMPEYLDLLSQYHWNARPDIKDAIKPKKFNGAIGNICLIALEDPLEKISNSTSKIFNTTNLILPINQ